MRLSSGRKFSDNITKFGYNLLMAKPILVANWKNHPSSLFEARALLKEFARNSLLYRKWSFFIASPYTYFESVSERVSRFAKLASQDLSILPAGSYTGEVTADILKSFGVQLAILGHSERRALGETSEDIAKKIKVCLRAGIVPLVCIGELAHDQDGEHFEFLREQLRTALSGISKKDNISKLIVAYEPVWAIGKSARVAIESRELSQATIFIKKVLSDILGRNVAERIPILYGGSVEPANANILMRETGINGFLVGHVSLNAKSFKLIAESILK